MAAILNKQIQSIYSLGRDLGILNPSDGHNDELHALVWRTTGKISIKALTEVQADKVISVLIKNLRYDRRSVADNQKDPCLCNCTQKRMIWRLMYELISYDRSDYGKTPGQRLCGIIKKTTGRTIYITEPFKDVTKAEASSIIEELKRYCASAKRKKLSGGGVHEPAG